MIKLNQNGQIYLWHQQTNAQVQCTFKPSHRTLSKASLLSHICNLLGCLAMNSSYHLFVCHWFQSVAAGSTQFFFSKLFWTSILIRLVTDCGDRLNLCVNILVSPNHTTFRNLGEIYKLLSSVMSQEPDLVDCDQGFENQLL